MTQLKYGFICWDWYKRPLHNFGLCKKAGHFDDILSLSKPAYVGRPIGGERKSKDRKKTGFTTHPKLCRGLITSDCVENAIILM